MNRRSFLIGTAAIGLAGTAGAATRSPGIAITVDDFNLAADNVLSGAARDQAIRKALSTHRIKAAGFVSGKYIDATVAPQVLGAWSADGHILGNHTFAHTYYSGSDPVAYMADIRKCEDLLQSYSGFQKIFRYPFLAEGKTAEGRDALRKLLHEAGYKIGHVTIDASDWYYSSRLEARIKRRGTTDLAPWRQAYLDHLWDRAQYYDTLAQDVFGHSIDHTLLLHHNLATALFLGDALDMFKARSWRLVNAADAFAQPEFANVYDTLPSGQSLVWAAAKATGKYEDRLRYPAEDGPYEERKLEALGLLPPKGS